MTEDLFDFPT